MIKKTVLLRHICWHFVRTVWW